MCGNSQTILVHATVRVFRVAKSTRNVAKSVGGILFELFDAMMDSTRRRKTALESALAFLPVMRGDHTLSEFGYVEGRYWRWSQNILRLKN